MRWRALVPQPVLDHAEIEDAHERAVGDRLLAIEESPQGIHVEQIPRRELSIQQMLPDLSDMPAVGCPRVAHEGAFAAPIEDLAGEHVREGGSGD